MEVIIKGTGDELAVFIRTLQGMENALYDFKNGVKITLSHDNADSGGGG